MRVKPCLSRLQFSLSNLRCYQSARSASSVASKPLEDFVQKSILPQIAEIKNAGTYKSERVIKTKQAVEIEVQGVKTKLLNFCANNYLGLSSHPAVVAAGKKALDEYGAGLSSVRFICGTQSIHKELEKQIAEFHGREDTILYASCFDANAGIFETLLTPQDAVLSDELNHASIIDGIRLCKAQKYRYKHMDLNDLETKLKEAVSAGAVNKLIVTDGVFSMDGDVAPLPQICDLADKYRAMVFVDECHATGFFGKTGRGTEEFFGIEGRVDFINSTLGKALGGAAGGYTTAKREVIDLLRQRSRPYLFSNSLPSPVVACASEVFNLLTSSSGFAEKVASNTERFREGMTAAGFEISVSCDLRKRITFESYNECSSFQGNNHPICPVMLYDAKISALMAEKLLDQGIYVIAFSYPVVPKGKARIRVQISAAHTENDIDRTIEAFTTVGRSLGVLK
ncbi:unnamed protein product [Notodromas monacha]|uniref:Aminotransferase class I/classII large domain-containing protein n=1 Tax=Notodromas monacha TaxID=399045 RepID=A0A7R9GDX8_9CRUS|nr:unnamed protein product [Notodromas monacha]CAG0919014.1 unnamed protein product [Notodromas monacha]